MPSPSRFLPSFWNPQTPIALLAGQGGAGSYPWEMVRCAQLQGVPLRLLSLKNETSPELECLFDKEFIRHVTVGELGGFLKALKELKVEGLVMAGRVDTGHVFKESFPDLKAIALWTSIKEKNAESIFGAVAGEIEKAGVKVLDARTFMDGQIADKGFMTKGKEHLGDEVIAHAIKIAETMAQNHVGQSVVCRKGTVLAVEAFEGTDAMIERAAGFKADEKIFVKTVKNPQDWRFDVPIFGKKTLDGLVASGIRTVVLKSESVIMPQKAELLKQAKFDGVTLLGY